MGEEAVANWQRGRLEVFFEGSWGQVCAGDFGPADADVACRQLGFEAGSAGPAVEFSQVGGQRIPLPPIFPEVILGTPGCVGTEASLLDCPLSKPSLIFSDLQAECLDSTAPGLTLACVRQRDPGESPCKVHCVHERHISGHSGANACMP